MSFPVIKNVPISPKFDASAARNNMKAATTAGLIETGIDAKDAFAGVKVTNYGELPMGIYASAMSLQNGVLRIIGCFTKKPENNSQKAIRAVEIGAGVAQTLSGTTKLTGNAISSVIAAAGSAVKVNNLSAVASIFGKVASGFGSLYSALTIIQPAIKIHSSRKLIAELKADLADGRFDLSRLKSLTPKAYAKILEKNQDSVTIGAGLKQEMIKELSATIAESAISIGTAVLTIISAIIGFVISGGVGALVGLGIGLFASAVSGGMDVKTMIESLKTAKGMSKKEFVLKIVTATLAAVSLALSVAFAPTVALAIAAGIVGLLVTSVPVASIAILKNKEAVLKAEAELKQSREQEALIKKLEEGKLLKKRLAELKERINYKNVGQETFNENYEVNLKLIRASGVFGKDQAFRWDSNKAMVSYAETERLFLEGVKNGKAENVISFNLKQGEKVDLKLINALSKVSDFSINGTLFPKALLNY